MQRKGLKGVLEGGCHRENLQRGQTRTSRNASHDTMANRWAILLPVHLRLVRRPREYVGGFATTITMGGGSGKGVRWPAPWVNCLCANLLRKTRGGRAKNRKGVHFHLWFTEFSYRGANFWLKLGDEIERKMQLGCRRSFLGKLYDERSYIINYWISNNKSSNFYRKYDLFNLKLYFFCLSTYWINN